MDRNRNERKNSSDHRAPRFCLSIMKLLEEVTFESLKAVREELREWLGPRPRSPRKGRSASRDASRDLLISVLIHNLVDDLSDDRARIRIKDSLTQLIRRHSRQFSD
jgi:hypothetical protein